MLPASLAGSSAAAWRAARRLFGDVIRSPPQQVRKTVREHWRNECFEGRSQFANRTNDGFVPVERTHAVAHLATANEPGRCVAIWPFSCESNGPSPDVNTR